MTRVILTYADYAALPADGRRHDIDEGELSVTAAPSPGHQQVLVNLTVVIALHVKQSARGTVLVSPIDVILSDTPVVQPDLVYVASDRAASISARGIEGPPTLVVEILSPSTTQIDRQTKMQLYARYRVPWYWIVESQRREIEFYGLAGSVYRPRARAAGEELLRVEPFADLALSVSSLWT